MNKRVFVAILGFVLMFSFLVSAQAADPIQPRLGDFLSGQLQMGVVVDPIMDTGIRPYEGLGYNSSLKLVAKKSIGILPVGIVFSAGRSADFEGNNDPLAKVSFAGLGWMRKDPKGQIEIGVDRLFLHKGDAIRFRILTSESIWSAVDTYYVSAIFCAEGILPIGSDNYFSGVNANIALRFDATDDKYIRLVQKFGAGADDGSHDRLPAGILFYEIFAQINAGNVELKFPEVKCVYANENGGDEYNEELRRDKEAVMVSFTATYNF